MEMQPKYTHTKSKLIEGCQYVFSNVKKRRYKITDYLKKSSNEVIPLSEIKTCKCYFQQFRHSIGNVHAEMDFYKIRKQKEKLMSVLMSDKARDSVQKISINVIGKRLDVCKHI